MFNNNIYTPIDLYYEKVFYNKIDFQLKKALVKAAKQAAEELLSRYEIKQSFIEVASDKKGKKKGVIRTVLVLKDNP